MKFTADGFLAELKPADVWRLCKDGFSVAEVAYLARVSDEVAKAMVYEAMPREVVGHG